MGDVDGIYIAPHLEPIPTQYITVSDVCAPDARHVEAFWAEAGALAWEFEPPDGYELLPDSLNTGAVACEDTVYTARRNYRYRYAHGQPAEVVIGRALFTHVEEEVSSDGVARRSFAGRTAIVISRVTDPIVQGYLVVFPERFGQTFIFAVGLTEAELEYLSRAVATGMMN